MLLLLLRVFMAAMNSSRNDVYTQFISSSAKKEFFFRLKSYITGVFQGSLQGVSMNMK